jgi:hypothetical protein
MKKEKGAHYCLYRYKGIGASFELLNRDESHQTFASAWNQYYNGGKHLGAGFYLIVKTTQDGNPDEIVFQMKIN